MVLHVPGFVFIVWVMHENTYLSRVVKIDEESGHQVITTGSCALVRHPMYSAVIVLVFGELPVEKLYQERRVGNYLHAFFLCSVIVFPIKLMWLGKSNIK